jgi:hypothetical protein
MVRLVEKLPRDVLFGELDVEQLGLAPPIRARFTADAFQQAPTGKPLSRSPDYVALAVAMVAGTEPHLPGSPDADYIHGLGKRKLVRRRVPLWWVD